MPSSSCPADFGTLDETFEILTWKKLSLHTKPVIILNVNGYWDPLLALIRRTRSMRASRRPAILPCSRSRPRWKKP